jgi:hypothetical protein
MKQTPHKVLKRKVKQTQPAGCVLLILFYKLARWPSQCEDIILWC